MNLSFNLVKLLIIGALAMACIVALIIDAESNAVWASSTLLALVGYVIGNADTTSRTGVTEPIISTHKS